MWHAPVTVETAPCGQQMVVDRVRRGCSWAGNTLKPHPLDAWAAGQELANRVELRAILVRLIRCHPSMGHRQVAIFILAVDGVDPSHPFLHQYWLSFAQSFIHQLEFLEGWELHRFRTARPFPLEALLLFPSDEPLRPHPPKAALAACLLLGDSRPHRLERTVLDHLFHHYSFEALPRDGPPPLGCLSSTAEDANGQNKDNCDGAHNNRHSVDDRDAGR